MSKHSLPLAAALINRGTSFGNAFCPFYVAALVSLPHGAFIVTMPCRIPSFLRLADKRVGLVITYAMEFEVISFVTLLTNCDVVSLYLLSEVVVKAEVIFNRSAMSFARLSLYSSSNVLGGCLCQSW